MCRRCEEEGIPRKRDFQQDKSGPEEMPHRKKGGKKRVRSDHKHEYEKTEHRIPLYSGEDYVYYVKKCIVCDRRA